MNAGIFILALVLLVSAAVADALPRVRRQASGFYLLTNTSLPCAELISQQPELQRVELTDSEKQQLMALKDIQQTKTLTAVTQQEALENFPSLLPLEGIYTDHVAQQLIQRRTGPNKITKKDITDFMINLYSGTKSGKSTREHSDKDHHNTDRTTIDADNKSDKDDFKSFLQRIEVIKDVEKRVSVWKRWMEKNVEDANFPLYFPEMLGIQREFTQADGRSVQLDFCQNRGSLTPDLGHVRMCTVCSATTTNPEGTWPLYMNEALCSATDSGCMIVNGIPHGTCQQIVAPINMLRKQTEQCTLIMKDGQTLIADHWDVITEVVNVGCECNILLSSIFTMYV